MATAKAGRKLREAVYVADIGNVGRQTGITLEARERDEHGLENADHLFSPTPGKPLPKAPLRLSNGKSDSSSTMHIAESSAPEPAQVLADGRSGKRRDGKSILPLPVMRSPIKSNLGTSPRRGSSMGPPSSPRQAIARESLQPISRKLEFTRNTLSQTPSSAGRRGTPRHSASATRLSNSVYDLPQSPEPEEMGPTGIDDDDDDDEQRPNGIGDGVDIVAGEDEHEADQENDGEDDAQVDEVDGQDDEAEIERQCEGDLAASQVQSPVRETTKRKRGRPCKDAEPHQVTDPQATDTQEVTAEAETAAPEPKRRGRPSKTDKSKATPLAAKSSNTRGRQPKAKEQETDAMPYAGQRHRLQTPIDADHVPSTKSGRHVYKPLQYWKGERAVYEEHTLQHTLKEIIRVDEPTPKKRKHVYIGARKPKKKRNYSVFEDDVDDDGVEPWEDDKGIVDAPVRIWDQAAGQASAVAEEDQTLAFAATMMIPESIDDNPNFLFNKTLKMPFFGSGVIEIPPKGMKGMKNSRKFQFAFFVHSGKVAVEIAGTRFVISRGGMWQVPRGNFYSITNESDRPAKIFFSQGCELPVEKEAPSLENLE